MHAGVRTFTLVGLSVLLIATLIGFVVTRQAADSALFRKSDETREPAQAKLVDQSPLETAYGLSAVASTDAEQKLLGEAIRKADQEVDLAFVTALQLTQLHPPVDNGETRELNERIRKLDSRLQELQEQVSQLAPLAANPGKNDAHAVQQQLEVAQARTTLLQDALDDAKEDLRRAGGDPQAQIKQELEDHEALQHGNATASSSQSKPAAFEVEENLVGQFRTWRRLRNSQARVLEAKQQAEAYAAALTRKHEALEKGLGDTLTADTTESAGSAATSAPAIEPKQHASKIAKLQELSQNTRALAQYDKRIQAEKQLAVLYGQWVGILTEQRRAALHAMLRSVLWILLALTALVVAEGLVERSYLKRGPDRRRMGTMRLVFRFVAQLLGVLVILLVLFGPPSQLSTVLALGAAGLTVALKDFLVALFGWFVLMGRHGIRVGDWVEINGIGGEVVEVGVLRTILLETGNWNDAGHPTGRRVSFVNSFAIEDHYFNFTTTGQWLWDELDVLVPAGEDPYQLTNAVLKLVGELTQADTAAAEQEWRRAAQRSTMQTFSAAPAINVRPTNLGVNLVVRYVVNAHNRYEIRTRLYQAIVELLHNSRRLAPAEHKTAPVNP